jgi:hypothetical protein
VPPAASLVKAREVFILAYLNDYCKLDTLEKTSLKVDRSERYETPRK